MNTAKALELFLDSRQELFLSPHTLAWYRYTLAPLAAAAPESPTEHQVRAWLRSAPSASSQRTWRRACRAFFRFCERDSRLCYPNPALEIPPAPGEHRLRPRVLTEAELRRLLAAAATDPVDDAAVTVLLDSGMRVGELASMRLEHIEVRPLPGGERQTIAVIRGKTGEREAPLSPESMRAILRIGHPSGLGPVFAITGRDGRRRPMANRTLVHRVRAAFERAGITGAKRGPHTLRHTFATLYIRAGGNVTHLQQVLGHATIRQTMVYVHLEKSAAFREHAALSPIRALSRPRQWALDDIRALDEVPEEMNA
jgi:integrase/recombinase XerD